MAICFIVGHGKSSNGGYDSGAVSKDGKIHEFQVAKKIAKFAQTYYNSYYNEQADCINYDGDLYLSDRIKKANNNKYDFVAEIHLNAGGGTGTECFYSKGSATGKKHADEISKAIASAFNVKNRGAKTKLNSNGSDYFGIIRQTNMEAVLIETLFIDTADINLIKTTEGQKKCGVAIAKAVAKVRGAKEKAGAENTANSTTSNPSKAVKLTNTPIYSSATSTKVATYKTGVFYIWNADVVCNRIRITNSEDRVGKSGQVTGWIDVNAINGKVTYKKGDEIKLANKPYYSNATTKTSKGGKTGTFYIYDGEKVNGRYRITNKSANCGKKPTWLYVTCWVEL